MSPYTRQNTVQLLEDFINNNISKMYTQSTIQISNDSFISPVGTIYETFQNFPFTSTRPSFGFHSKNIQSKNKRISSKKLFLNTCNNKQANRKRALKTDAEIIHPKSQVKTSKDCSKLNLEEVIYNLKSVKKTGRKRALKPGSEDINFSVKLIKIAIDDQSKKEFDSRMNIRETVVAVYNKVADTPKISKSLNISKYHKTSFPSLKNINEEIQMLLDQIVGHLLKLKNLSKYSELTKYCVILKLHLVPCLPEDSKDLIVQAIGYCNV